MKKLFLLVSIVVLTISCTKEEEYVDPLIELAETAKADSIAMIEFMNTHKLIIDNEGEYENNINWKVEEITDNDAEDVQSLFDIMGANRIDWVYGGITFNVYYYQVNEGTGINPASSDVIRVDYNAYDLPNKLVDNSVSSVRFTLSSLIGGWQLALPYFKSGSQPEGFPIDCGGCDPYREQIETPGKGIILVPSSLAYGNGNIMLFDMVLYDVIK